MKLEEVRNIARLHSIKPSHLSKADLIRSIQLGEGNFDCFATASSGECDQMCCLWRSDCFDAAQKGELS